MRDYLSVSFLTTNTQIMYSILWFGFTEYEAVRSQFKTYFF